MRRRLIFAVVLLNLALAGALVASPLASQVFPASFLRRCTGSPTACTSVTTPLKSPS